MARNKMKRVVRIGKVEDQDRFRREAMRQLTPSARLEKFLEWRDICYPDAAPIKRIASVKKVPWQTDQRSPTT